MGGIEEPNFEEYIFKVGLDNFYNFKTSEEYILEMLNERVGFNEHQYNPFLGN
jgi:hypothetical protein